MPVRTHLPTRVSRLYPLFALVLAITSSILFYAYESSVEELNSLSGVEQRQKDLHAQVDALTAERSSDRSRLSLQDKKLAATLSQLSTAQSSLAAAEKQLSEAQTQIKNQQDQLSQNAAELQQLRSRPPLFSFQNNSSLADVSGQEADVKQLVTDSYPYLQALYGDPYLLHRITITFVDNFSIAGSSGEILISNGPSGVSIDIHLKSFDKTSFQDINTVLHEEVHGFHAVAALDSSAFEEGMTVAATDALMERMMADGKIPHFDHLYLIATEQQYNLWNQTLQVPENNSLFYSSPQIAQIYEMIGTAWFRFYRQDPDFFKKLNAAYYAKVQKGYTPDNPLILDAIRSIIKTVDGQPIDTYLAQNRAFNPA